MIGDELIPYRLCPKGGVLAKSRFLLPRLDAVQYNINQIPTKKNGLSQLCTFLANP